MPSSRGIWMSITTTSGRLSSTTCSASRPSAAVPTTSIPSSAPSSAARPSRTIGGRRRRRRGCWSWCSACSSGAARRARPCRRSSGQVTSLRPPSSAARSRSDTRPTPASASAAMPRRRRRPRRRRASSLEPQPYGAGRGAGVRARRWPAPRRRSGRPPPRPRPGSAAEVVGLDRGGERARETGSACWRSAPTRPRSSSAGGRRSCTSRRTSATTSCTWPLVSPILALGGLGVVVDQQPGGLELEHHAAERRTQPVVQVAADPAALLLAGGDEPLAALLQLLGQPAGAGRGRRLPDEVAEQLLVAAGQPAAQPARRAAPAGRPRASR